MIDYDLIPAGSRVYLVENIEAKRPHIIKRLEAAGIKDHDVIINGLVQSDPIARRSNGKKTPFVSIILNWIINGTTIFPEDIKVTHDLLAKYEKLTDKKPIDQYKSFSDLYGDIGDKEKERSYSDVAKLVAEEGQFKMYRIDNWEQGEFCFKDSGWCVQDVESFNNEGPPYFMITKGNKRFALLHKGNDQVKDVKNKPLTLELARLIKPLIEMIWPEGGYKGDFFEIVELWPEQIEKLKHDPWYAHGYARDVIGDRWPEAEPYIMKNINAALNYAADVIKDRWPEAEPHIMKDAETAYNYAKNVIGDRWPEAEPYIMETPHMAFNYTQGVINKDKRSGEPKTRWPEAEPYMMKNAAIAYHYARNIIEGRWLEAESYIMKDSSLWSEYKKYFDIKS